MRSSPRGRQPRTTLLFLLAGLLLGLVGCTGELGGGEAGGSRRAAASGACAALSLISADDLISIKNTAYFEASYLPSQRASECARVAGTIIGRAHQGGFGSGYQGVITAAYQFEVYSAVRLCAGGSCYRLTDGVGLDQADQVQRYGRTESASSHLGGYQECSSAVEEALRSTPGTIYLFFAAAGDGTNAFRSPTAYPQGCNLLEGSPAPAPAAPAEPGAAPEPAAPAEPAPANGCQADADGHSGCLHGTVREAGELQVGIYVSAWGRDRWDFHTTHTDGNGIYSFGGLHPSSQYNMAINAIYRDGAFYRIDPDHPCEVRDNVDLDAGDDGWHGEWFDLEYEDDPDHCRGTL